MTRDILRREDLPIVVWYRIQLDWEVGTRYEMSKILMLQSRKRDMVPVRNDNTFLEG